MSEFDAGPELDRLIAERIFGKVVLDNFPPPRIKDWRLWHGLFENEVLTREAEQRHYEYYRYNCGTVPSVPQYSTHLEDAWRVVNALNEKGWRVKLVQVGYPAKAWQVTFFTGSISKGFEAQEELVAHAICMAAYRWHLEEGRFNISGEKP